MPEVIRAAELPVNRCLDLSWADFCKLVHNCWSQSTALANWGVQQLAKSDVVRTPGMEKLPRMPPCLCPICTRPISKGPHKGKPRVGSIYLYGHFTQSDLYPFWVNAYPQAVAVLKEAEDRYRAMRYDIVWTRSATLPTFRYPHPLPVHNACWTPRYEHGRPVVNVKLPGGAVNLELRGGPEFARQLAAFRSLVNGEAKQCALAIRGQYTTSSNGRQTMEERSPGGGDRRHLRILCKLVLRTEAQQRSADRVLTLCTDPQALWVAELDGRRAWVLNADHVRRACLWQETHRVQLQRWADDTKAERRSSPSRRQQFNESRERCCLKHARRMDSWIKESCSHLLRFCLRQHVGQVAYLNHDTGFLPGFPWHKLNTRLVDLLQANGIEVIVPPESGETVAGAENENMNEPATIELSVNGHPEPLRTGCPRGTSQNGRGQKALCQRPPK